MSAMGRKSIRKLFLFGKYSLALLPPKQWLQEMGVQIGDTAELELDKTRQRIIVRFGKTDPNKSLPKTTKKRSDGSDDSEYEPIPPI